MPPQNTQKVILTPEYLKGAEAFEGCHQQAYFDCAGYPTFGIGHLIKQTEYRLYFGDTMNITAARGLWKSNRDLFYSRIPRFTLDYVHDLKRKDMASAARAVENKLLVCKVNEAPPRLLELLTDLVFNGGPGFLDGSIAQFLRKKDFDGAALFSPEFTLARDPHSPDPRKRVPFAGLTFRRYSFVWYYFTGEFWRIGGERGKDEDWREADDFLHKLDKILAAKGRKNPLPYDNNRREAQRY